MTEFSRYQQALLALVRKSLGSDSANFDFSALSADDWSDVSRESRSQTVDLLCFDGTKGLSLPDNVSLEWLTRSAAIFSRNLKIINTQNKLCRLLESCDIPYVILKGLASSCFYPNSENRILGDIDFLVPSEFLKQTEELLIGLGCVPEEHSNDTHEGFMLGDVELELHFCVAGIPEGDNGEPFREYFKDIFTTSVTDPLQGFKKPCDAAHGVVILLHVLHHVLSKGIGLRQICDWACFISATDRQAFWQDELIPLFKRAGLFKFVCIVTDVAVRYLGATRPDWLKEPDEEISAEFMVTVLARGNFGQKVKEVAGSSLMVIKNSEKNSVFRRMGAMLKSLNQSNRKMYPILNKCPLLYPFIMIWRVLRYLGLMIVGKRQSLTKAFKYADERQAQFEKFELFKKEENSSNT